MNRKIMQISLVFAILAFGAIHALAHCQVPCGIYDDQMRINMISEHITTIEKSMKEIVKLQTEQPINFNQLVRWIINKEDHAKELQQIVSEYFMTQRIKPEDKDLQKQLSLLHKMLVEAMKCKQTTDVVHVEELRKALKEFSELYLENSHQHKK